MTPVAQLPALLGPGANIAAGVGWLYQILDVGHRYTGPHTGEAVPWSAAPYSSLCRSISLFAPRPLQVVPRRPPAPLDPREVGRITCP